MSSSILHLFLSQILSTIYLSNHTAFPLSFPSLSSEFERFSFYLTLLFLLHLCISSSISPCLPLFSIFHFFYLKSFPHLSFSISSSSSTSTLLFPHSMSYSSFVFIYLPTSFILHLFFSLPCFSFIFSTLHFLSFPPPLWSTILSSMSSAALYFLLFQFSRSLLLIPRTSLFN